MAEENNPNPQDSYVVFTRTLTGNCRKHVMHITDRIGIWPAGKEPPVQIFELFSAFLYFLLTNLISLAHELELRAQKHILT
jgi:hypothetical protein